MIKHLLSWPKVIAHRGASAYAPENTMAAFEKARSLGGKWIEFDVTLSLNGDIFVFHDDFLHRTTNGSGQIIEASSEYIQTLDAGAWFDKRFYAERVPRLQTVITWLAKHPMQANIEIKTYPTEQLTLAVLAMLEKEWPKQKPSPLISSFDYKALQICHQQRPDLPLGYLLDKIPQNWLEKARQIQCASINVSRRIATKQLIQRMKAESYAVCVYTVNRRTEAFKLLDWGVDAVFSDYPDLLS